MTCRPSQARNGREATALESQREYFEKASGLRRRRGGDRPRRCDRAVGRRSTPSTPATRKSPARSTESPSNGYERYRAKNNLGLASRGGLSSTRVHDVNRNAACTYSRKRASSRRNPDPRDLQRRRACRPRRSETGGASHQARAGEAAATFTVMGAPQAHDQACARSCGQGPRPDSPTTGGRMIASM